MAVRTETIIGLIEIENHGATERACPRSIDESSLAELFAWLAGGLPQHGPGIDDDCLETSLAASHRLAFGSPSVRIEAELDRLEADLVDETDRLREQLVAEAA